MAANDLLSTLLDSAIEGAKRAGEIIRKGFYETKHVEHKGLVDLVTETDKACEDLIFNYLLWMLPLINLTVCFSRDVSGGAVIVKEAGGLIFDPSGRDFDITSQRVAASNPLLKDAFVEALQLGLPIGYT